MAMLELRCSMVSIVVIKGEGVNTQVLLLQRASEYLRGVWSYVAGHIESNETGWQTAIRELHEETGLAAQMLFATSFCEQFYDAGNDCIMVVPAFVARVDDDCVVQLNDEHSALRWLSFEFAMCELPFGSQRELFAYVQREFIDRPPSEHLRIALH
ncbi:NUDIX pyrophosphatase [Pusillimonas sp. ANT_WB101]|uniref:NUDIX hydrolase n=1 Tax=Pusillimonas sp. ANT_WB101 TaxID=2597356 RepID=UPI0011EE8887|nr:NUDIX domain-containing protein [Pusillimonas sp. ANT_WB101]KAA0911082.1 NUDIX domain-containing protein [Pusillimonas sp. ANT_WB101]